MSVVLYTEIIVIFTVQINIWTDKIWIKYIKNIKTIVLLKIQYLIDCEWSWNERRTVKAGRGVFFVVFCLLLC